MKYLTAQLQKLFFMGDVTQGVYLLLFQALFQACDILSYCLEIATHVGGG